jgi:hypothetical protein
MIEWGGGFIGREWARWNQRKILGWYMWFLQVFYGIIQLFLSF